MGPFPETDAEHDDFKLAGWAAKQLQSASPGPSASGQYAQPKPFFLAVGFRLPHVPLYVPQRWLDLYPLDRLVMPPVKVDS